MAKKNTDKAKVGSAFDLVGQSWEAVKKNWQLFALVNVFAILGAIGSAFDKNERQTYFYGVGPFNGPETSMSDWPSGLSIVWIMIAAAVFGFVLLFLSAMSTRLELSVAKGKSPSLQELVEAGKKYWFRLFLVFLAAGIIIVIGLILLIVPGIIAIGRLIFVPYVMVDKDLGVVEAIRESNRLAYGRAGAVWSAIGVTVLIGIAAAIISNIPGVGPLIGALIGISFSLIIVLRYVQIKKLARA